MEIIKKIAIFSSVKICNEIHIMPIFFLFAHSSLYYRRFVFFCDNIVRFENVLCFSCDSCCFYLFLWKVSCMFSMKIVWNEIVKHARCYHMLYIHGVFVWYMQTPSEFEVTMLLPNSGHNEVWRPRNSNDIIAVITSHDSKYQHAITTMPRLIGAPFRIPNSIDLRPVLIQYF